MHQVVVLAFDGVVGHDVSLACQVFSHADGAYEVSVAGASEEVDAGFFRMRLGHGPEALERADTVVLPGVSALEVALPEALASGVRAAYRRGARVVSICTGAFLLARLGLLDGREATTHWKAADALASTHPGVRVDPRALYLGDGQVYTSAGALAGMDLCLHLVREDLGANVAARVARASVMALERSGDQSQFIEHPDPAHDETSLADVLTWVQENLASVRSNQDIAQRACMSSRSLSRHFLAQTGVSPHKWLVRARVRRAQELLESTDLSIERISEAVGFGTAAVFRRHFQRLVSTPPSAYRRAFRARV